MEVKQHSAKWQATTLEFLRHGYREWLQNNLKGDPAIWIIAFFLSIFGVVVVYSASSTLAFVYHDGDTGHFLRKHLSLVILSWLTMYAAHLVPVRHYGRAAKFFLWISVPLLIATFAYGKIMHPDETPRWIKLPFGFSFQPSDLAKISLVVSLAAMLAKRQNIPSQDYKPHVFWNMMIWIFVVCILIMFTNNSTAILLGATCFVMFYIGRVPRYYMSRFVATLIGVLLVGIFALVLMPDEKKSSDKKANQEQTSITQKSVLPKVFTRVGTLKGRIVRWWRGEVADQSRESYIAIANGGTTGIRPGGSHQRNYLKESANDFIFAIIIEEYGLLTAIAVVLAYVLLIVRGVRTVERTTHSFHGLLVAGLMLSIGLQAFTNMCVAVGLVPVTGQPLPLVSLGGTSLLFTALALGIVQSVNRAQNEEAKNGRA